MSPSNEFEILIVDDESSIRWVIEKTLSGRGYGLNFAEDAEQGEKLLAQKKIDFALVDINLPGEDGFSFLQNQRAAHPDLLMAVITGQSTMDNAVTAMKLGAFDYLTKPFDIDEIESLVSRASQAVRAAGKHRVQSEPDDFSGQDLIIGRSRSIREIYKSIGRVADTDITVLIQGESGTGKELIARSIHHHSSRVDRPFVAVNCAAIPRELLESELFGYEKGAFTGATERKAGKLEAAADGSIFLDEIGDMPLDLQAKLLRVLQEREFQRVGGLETLRLRARVITATNQSLLETVEKGGFRADLYYRISSFQIVATPLRERKEDIPLLSEYFLQTGAARMGLARRRISDEAMEKLITYDWPGNVRELENAIKSLTIMTRTNLIDVVDLPRNIVGEGGDRDFGGTFEQEVLNHWGTTIREACASGEGQLLEKISAHLERPLIRQVLKLVNWNQIRAAAILGINRNTLRTKLKTLGLKKPEKESP